MKLRFLVVSLLALCLVLAGCSGSGDSSKDSKSSNDSHQTSSHKDKKDDKDKKDKNDENALQIAAAASLTDASKDLEKEFKKDHKDANITFNYGGSGALRQQIEKGAPTDVIMSANTKDVDMLKDKDKAHDTYNYAKNKLVLIGDKDSNYKSVKDLKKDDKLAVGEAKSVPAGKYAEKYLKANNLYDKVEPNLVYAKDVRQVLNYVKKGNAQLGYVYKTDLAQDQKNGNSNVKEINEAKLDKPITYEAGATSDKKLAKEWMDFLKSDKAKEILKKYEFEA
ncbi:molybdate ABC transporter substrate-binding protein [Staphylococcus pettenkoferi]|uniref:Molybdate ABC transporter substrate-binding protein n=1 Tax=Staphylococcus pettenkoferi TaxID=170573 RepID=A0ABT4BPF6_9STAP|nr:molybdate ABC transporter substrate-binding protein [Staphylococcus pettenkoferi]MCY1565020.1 molybdate ABC transporter substrate-binding protein [Staphylococcus pettenkoferi]MCY1572664.1 molybdate ABC transporter substrate-binding protein [Staphylococcus pettenkoferi]MCY1583822.1 molybdate ABC transporter substrate-binding protein [Staphylococcus pettenkoferi]MCY1591952.1 molybdate ABC transporter substrate-binding protein [Staphylococcus pettenkoferi]MCY1606978.1 molybdate ABC transporter